RDTTLLVPDLVRQIGRNVAHGVKDEIADDEQALRAAQKIVSPGSLAAAERLARTDQRITAEPAQWDRDPDLINTPAGIVDTRTGAVRPHDADAYMTASRPRRRPRPARRIRYGRVSSIASPAAMPRSPSTCSAWPAMR